MSEYESNLTMLLPYVVMKVLGYSHPEINWNCWLDRQPFVGK